MAAPMDPSSVPPQRTYLSNSCITPFARSDMHPMRITLRKMIFERLTSYNQRPGPGITTDGGAFLRGRAPSPRTCKT
jgi:hypothetical protein